MAPYKITIAYDGTDFFGFQRQSSERTVQLELENALQALGWTGKSILFSGRTDKGVHAEGQVIAFDLDWSHNEYDLVKALNVYLPSDVAAVTAEKVSESFHPRFDASLRCYRYQIYNSFIRNPLLERYYWSVWPEPKQEILKKAASLILGKHDFRRFGKPPDEGTTTVRTIEKSEWKISDDGYLTYRISSKAFLYHMVRRIVFLLVRIAQGRIELTDLADGIKDGKDLPAGIAPANGLFLEKIIY